ncbi:MAG: polysaccharide pyruvyl transferase family protein [Ginsengibacter sp.]
MKKINVGLIWANPYSGNLGVSALAYSSLYLLEKVSKQKNIEFTYIIIDGSGPENDTLNIGECSVDITNVVWDYTGTFKTFVKVALFKWKQIFTAARLDIIFDMGEGDSFSDIYGIRRFRKINGSKKLFRLMGKKQVLLPQTIGPFYSEEAKTAGNESIDKTQLVLARDRQSFNYITKNLPEKKVYELIDLAFFMPFEKTTLENDKVKIGINISGLLWHGGYTKDNQFSLKTNFKDLMIRTINYFLADDNNDIFFVAHVISPNYENLDNDLKVCHELNKIYPSAKLAPAFKNPIEAKSFISGMDFFTGARMHSCIASFSAGVPVYPLAYSRKFNGLFGDTLGYEFYGDLVNSEIDDVFNDMKSAFSKRLELKEKINSILQDEVSKKETMLLDLISGIVEK